MYMETREQVGAPVYQVRCSLEDIMVLNSQRVAAWHLEKMGDKIQLTVRSVHNNMWYTFLCQDVCACISEAVHVLKLVYTEPEGL